MTLRVVELFSGIGAQRMALMQAGIDHEVVAISEINKHSLASYEAIYGDCPNLGDISKVEKLPPCDLVTYSFPCLSGDTLVETSEGWTPIKDVRPGDEVWSRDGWRKVTDHAMTGSKEVWEVKGSQTLPILATGYHLFLARRMSHVWNNDRRSYDRVFAPARWVKAEDLTTSDYLGYRIPEEGPMPEYEGYTRVYSDGRVYRRTGLASLWTDERLWWAVGRYVADGFIRKDGNAVLCIGRAKAEDIGRIPMHPTVSDEGLPAIKAVVTSKEFGMLCERFGKGAENKRIPQEYKTLPKRLARAMLDGYLSGDGWYNHRNDTWGATTVSRTLALDLAELVAYVHGRPSSITYRDPSPTGVIEGRTVNQRRQYTVRFHLDSRRQDKAFAEDGWIWFPVKSVKRTGRWENVYDITVEGSHSFTAGGCIVKNCQDLSLAGKRAGMGEGTRSGLVWEVVRLLESAEERERPEWLLMENVPMVTSSELWPELLSRLSRMGYVNEYKDLDSSRFGSAQKRVRTFMLSRLGRFPPSLPTSTDAPPRCIRDIMEDEVEERFIRRIPLERIKWREPIKGYHHPQSDGIDCPLLDASDPRLETRRIASEESLCPTLRTGVSVRVVSEEEEEERAKALCEKADNVRLAPKGEKSIGTASEGGTRLVVSPEEQRRKAGIDRDAELVEEHFRMAKGPGDRVRHEDGFEEGSSRKEGGLYSVQKEDGHVRFYRGNRAKAGLSEAQYYPADSQSPAVTSSHPPKVLDVDGGIGVLADIQKGGRMQNNRLHDPLGQSPALRTHGGGDHDIKVVQGIEAYDPDADIHVFGCRDDEGNIDQNADPTVAFRNRRVYLDDGKAPACVVHTTKIPVVDSIAPPLDEIHVVGDDKEDSFEWRARVYGEDGKAQAITDLGRRGKEFLKVADRVEPSSTPVAENMEESFYSGRMLYSSSSSPTVRTFHGRSCQIKVIDGIETTSGEDDACDPTDTRGDRTELVPRMEEGDVCPMLTPGRRVKRQNGQRYREPNSPAFTVTCQDHNGCAYPKDGDLIVRVLTPLECWRLMGFPDWAYERASKVSSETQLYNQAGNSIVVEVLEAIFKAMTEPPKAEQSMLTRWLRWMPPQS